METDNLSRTVLTPDRTKWGLRLLSFAAFAILWELSARTLNSLLMPTFTDTMVALAHLLLTPALWDALWVSNQAMVLGFAAGAVRGLPGALSVSPPAFSWRVGGRQSNSSTPTSTSYW